MTKMTKKTKIILTVTAILSVLIVAVVASVLLTQGSGNKYNKHLKLAQKYIDEMEYEQAIAELRAAIKIDPKREDAYLALADAYIEMEDYDNALTALKEGLREAGSPKIGDKIGEIRRIAEKTGGDDDSGNGDSNGNGGEGDGNGESGGNREDRPITVEIKKTDIYADSVFNTEGYGSLTIQPVSNEYDEYIPPRYALIDRKGEFVFQYDRFPCSYVLSDGLFVNGGGGRGYTIYNLEGKQVIDQSYNWISDLVNGYALAENRSGNPGYGDVKAERVIIDANGKEVYTLPSANLMSFGDGDFSYEYKTKCYGWDLEYNDYSEGLVNISYIKPLGKGRLSELISSEDEAERTESYGWYAYSAYMNLDGNIVIPNGNIFGAYGGEFRDGLAWATDRSSGLTGFINKSGKWVIPAKYTGVGPFSEGFAIVWNAEHRAGYINAQDNLIIPIEYDGAVGYASGLFVVGRKENDVMKWGAVDRNNQVVVPLEYDRISDFEQGVGYGIRDGYINIISIVQDAVESVGGAGSSEAVAHEEKLVREVGYYADGRISHKVEYEYDRAGNQIKKLEYSNDGSIDIWYEYEYDRAGNLKKYAYYDGDGNILGWYNYEYDRAGNQIKSERYEASGNVSGWSENEFDRAGNLVKEVSYDDYTGMKEECEKEYDRTGNLIKEVRYDADSGAGSFYMWCEYEYDRAGNLVKCVRHNSGGILGWEEYEYDGVNLTKCVYYNKDGSSAGVYKYEYDQAGNQVKEVFYDVNGSIIGWTEYEYQAVP